MTLRHFPTSSLKLATARVMSRPRVSTEWRGRLGLNHALVQSFWGGESEKEGTALTDPAFHPNFSRMMVKDAPARCEANSGALNFRGGINPLEHFEQAFKMHGVNTHAIVPNREFPIGSVALPPEFDDRRAVLGPVFEGISQQILNQTA